MCSWTYFSTVERWDTEPPARSAAGIPVSTPITVQTGTNEQTFWSVRDEQVIALGGMLTSYYGKRHGSVANDDEYVNRERAAESARERGRMQN